MMCRKVGKYKKNPNGTLKLKSTSEVEKILLGGLDTRLDTAEDKISKLEEIAIEPIKN